MAFDEGGVTRQLKHLSKQLVNLNITLRTVPTIVTAHTFCASQDTQVSYWLTNTGIFLRSFKLCGESRTQQVLLVPKKKIEGNTHFSEIIKLQFGKERHTLLCI